MQYRTLNPRQTHFFHDADTAMDEKDDDSRGVYFPPAMVFVNGQVLTRIWANQNHWHDITWKIDQVRVRKSGQQSRVSRSFFVDDLQDAMRGLYHAQKWVRRAERRRNKRWLWWW